jgi:DNA-binding NtrC family response regulator
MQRAQTLLNSRTHIFVVDDENAIASVFAKILRLQGFRATHFNQPLKALEAARLEAPDMLVSDVVMPGMSGIDLAAQIWKTYPECKVLLCSGQASSVELIDSARAAGYSLNVLQKPVSPSLLLGRIRGMTRSTALRSILSTTA